MVISIFVCGEVLCTQYRLTMSLIVTRWQHMKPLYILGRLKEKFRFKISVLLEYSDIVCDAYFLSHRRKEHCVCVKEHCVCKGTLCVCKGT